MKNLTLILLGVSLLAACSAEPATPASPSNTQDPTSNESPAAPVSEPDAQVSFATAQAIVKARCFACHGDGNSRGGVTFDKPEDLKAKASRIKFRAVENQTMPPGNTTGITDAERKTLGQWIEQGAAIN